MEALGYPAWYSNTARLPAPVGMGGGVYQRACHHLQFHLLGTPVNSWMLRSVVSALGLWIAPAADGFRRRVTPAS
jgi:hypothetical protein